MVCLRQACYTIDILSGFFLPSSQGGEQGSLEAGEEGILVYLRLSARRSLEDKNALELQTRALAVG